MNNSQKNEPSNVPPDESRETLQTLMGNLPGMAYRCRLDEHWTLEFASAGARTLTGYEPDELCFNRVIAYAALLHPGDQERVRTEILEAVEREAQFQVTYRITTRQGAKRWVWEQGCAVERAGQQVLEGFITDITDLKLAEATARDNAARANSLRDAAAELNAQLDLPAVLEAVCTQAVKATGSIASVIFLYHEKEALFVANAAHGILPGRLSDFRPIARETFDRYLELFEFPRYMPDLLTNEDVTNRDYYQESGIRSAAVAHVARSGELIGLLIVYFEDAPETMPQARLDLLQGFSDLAAHAISNAKLFDQSQRRLRRLEALRAIDGAIVGRRRLEDALSVVTEQVKEQLGVDAVCIFLFDAKSEALKYAAGTGFETETISRQEFGPGQGLIGRVAAPTGPGAGFPERWQKVPADYLPGEQFRSFLGVRLATDERLSGVMAIFQRGEPVQNGEWLAFLESLAVQGAIAIDNANLLVKTQRLLRRTQMQANQIRQIVDSFPEGVILLDRQKRVVLANPIGREYLEALSSAGVGDQLTQLAGNALESLLPTMSTQSDWKEVRAEQLQRTFEIAFERLHDGPQSGGWIMVIWDVTEERQRQKRQQMQERLATVGQLAAGIAHDFNNILGVITLYTEMLLSTLTLTDTQHKRLSVVNEQAQQAAALVRQILDFSRQSVIERRPVELKSFVKEVVQLLERTLPENVQVELEYDEERSYIASADLTRLQQVLMNLAVNARDAMPDGGRLQLGLYAKRYDKSNLPLPEMDAGHWVVISVADTGAGISDDDLPHVFEPFFTTKPRGEGTGLGLAQVYGIVQQHEGHIDVASTVGEGSTFTIYLPMPVTQDLITHHASREQHPHGDGETILVVEDNPLIQQALQEALLALNYQVLIAEDGEQALQILAQRSAEVSLVISDLVMPRMGGAGLHGQVRQLYPELRMVVMTGYPVENQNRELLEHGDIFWLQKPFSMETTAETVRRALTSARPT